MVTLVEGTYFKDRIQYLCNLGYELPTGDILMTLTCGADRLWESLSLSDCKSEYSVKYFLKKWSNCMNQLESAFYCLCYTQHCWMIMMSCDSYEFWQICSTHSKNKLW